jgi:hypothetical protein
MRPLMSPVGAITRSRPARGGLSADSRGDDVGPQPPPRAKDGSSGDSSSGVPDLEHCHPVGDGGELLRIRPLDEPEPDEERRPSPSACGKWMVALSP